MTVPYERTRALRFGWEFLVELQEADNLNNDQKRQLENIVRHYPTNAEIEKWAEVDATAHLGPEKKPIQSRLPLTAQGMKRGPTTPSERTCALRLAEQFFRDLQSAPNTTANQIQEIPYVLRHFPNATEIAFWARMDANSAAQNPSSIPWLAPEQKLASLD